jgi:hypothetical protein
LGTGNTVSINVNVTSIGAYSITTGTVNGISFSNSGNLNVTGPQTVTLLGSGTPLAPGAYNYTANGNPGSCDFSVTAITTTVNNDYFPLTLKQLVDI